MCKAGADGMIEDREKKILMLINFFPPAAGGGVYRPLSFVRHLAGGSWKVTVITPMEGEFWINDPGLMEKVPSGVRVVRTSSLSGQRLLGKIARRSAETAPRRSTRRFGWLRSAGEWFMIPDTYVGWVPFALKAAGELCREEKFDALYSTSPPDSTHLGAGRISRSYNIPWIADFRDPWISLWLRDVPTFLHRRIHRAMERGVSRADRVIVTTDWQMDKMRELYPESRTVKIPNGYDEDDFPVGGGKPPQKPFTILHGGMLTLGRSTGNFLKGFSLFLERWGGAADGVRVVFMGPRESGNERWVKDLGLEEQVSFVDNVPHARCVLDETRAHLLLLIKHDDERYRGLVPGKLFEYIGARRPILAIAPEGEAARIVRNYRRGEVVSPGDHEGIAGAIGNFYQLYLDGGINRAYSLEELPALSRRAGAEKLEAVLTEILEEK